MALFNLQKIAAIAAGQQTYLRGVSCYNGGFVKHLQRTKSGAYSEIVTADVDDDRHTSRYRCEVCFDFDGKPVQMDCSCPVYHAADGACKHLVAVMVHKYYTDMVSGIAPAASVRVAPPDDRTDEIAAAMIKRYMDREAATLTAQATSPAAPIRLLPEIHIHGQSVRLCFSLRGTRDYVLRDLRAFAAAVTQNDTVSYGKELTFFHHPDSFAPEDRALLRFLIGQIPPVPRGTVGGHAIRELSLTPVALDAFMSLMRDRAIICHRRGISSTVTVKRADPSLTVHVTKKETGYTLENNDSPETVLGNRRRYVLLHDTVYACSTAFCDATSHLLDALQASHGRLFVSDKDMPTLCVGALKAVGDHLTFEGDLASLSAFRPAPMQAELYLDSPDRQTVVAKLLYCYGDRRVTAFTDAPLDGVTRDTLAEYRLTLLMKRLFPVINEQDGRMTLTADDEGLFRFMTDGLADLSQHTAVYATDRVRAVGMAPPPNVSVGVRLQSDLLDITLDTDLFDRDELKELLASYREKRTYHRLRSGSFLKLDDPSLLGLYALAEEFAAAGHGHGKRQITMPAYRALYIDRILRDNPAIRMRRDEGFRRLIRDISAVADNAFSPPDSLDTVLRNYQKTGFRWLKTMEQYGFGGILADDMGLGKTLQMISLLLDAKQQGESAPSLVVCPASLVYNWQSELARFAPALRVTPIIGDKETRETILKSDLTDADVYITSYDLLKRDIALYAPHRFAYHVIDEAQYIKNAATHSARANKSIHSRHRFALTGTPIENRLSELWSIFDFLMPGFLYSYPRFRERLETPIAQGDSAALSRLDKLVSPFIMRRLKKDVLRELPDKHESVVKVPLTGEQLALYTANVNLLKEELHEKGLARNHITVLSMLTRLRQLCCSPSLCYENYHAENAKLDVCMELVTQAVSGGHKVLLFSQFTSLLDILKKPVTREGIPFYELRGSTPKEQRAAMVEAFNKDDTPLFLISLKAGGTGLNLTGADVVIHFDPWWNISAQNQATDRAHRIGQTHTVQVYKLIASDTVEEKILAMQERKQALADAVVHEGDGILSGMTAEDLLTLLS